MKVRLSSLLGKHFFQYVALGLLATAAAAFPADMTERVQFNKFDNNWVKSLWALFFIEYQYILWQKLEIGVAHGMNLCENYLRKL